MKYVKVIRKLNWLWSKLDFMFDKQSCNDNKLILALTAVDLNETS